VSGRRVGKTQSQDFKTNCGRHLKKRHFQLSLQANRFSLDGEENFESDNPWKKKRSLSGNSEDGSEDEESKDGHTSTKA
jgi:hypothetical protein